jgi:hypothetical protein
MKLQRNINSFWGRLQLRYGRTFRVYETASSAPSPFTCLQPEMEVPERNRNDRPRCRSSCPVHAESVTVRSNFYLGKLPESAGGS